MASGKTRGSKKSPLTLLKENLETPAECIEDIVDTAYGIMLVLAEGDLPPSDAKEMNNILKTALLALNSKAITLPSAQPTAQPTVNVRGDNVQVQIVPPPKPGSLEALDQLAGGYNQIPEILDIPAPADTREMLEAKIREATSNGRALQRKKTQQKNRSLRE